MSGPVGGLDDAVVERIADAMFALSTPSRVQILGLLSDQPRTVTELTAALGMEQSAVSHQLRVLRDHLLVRVVQKKGRTRVYGLHDEHVRVLLDGALRHVQSRRRPTKGLARRRGDATAAGA